MSSPPFDLEISPTSKWQIGIVDRGHGHKSYHVIDEHERLIVDCGENRRLAYLLLHAPLMADGLRFTVKLLNNGSEWADTDAEFAKMKELAKLADSIFE